MSNERSMSGSRPYRSIVNAAVLCTLIILACATADVCPQGCVTVLGKATALAYARGSVTFRYQRDCYRAATVRERFPSEIPKGVKPPAPKARRERHCAPRRSVTCGPYRRAGLSDP